jgi:hypothetical protein
VRLERAMSKRGPKKRPESGLCKWVGEWKEHRIRFTLPSYETSLETRLIRGF